jgi:hypothetical protein
MLGYCVITDGILKCSLGVWMMQPPVIAVLPLCVCLTIPACVLSSSSSPFLFFDDIALMSMQ